MRVWAILASVLLSSGCAAKLDSSATAGGEKKPPKHEKLPADAVLWEGELGTPVDSTQLLEKDGILVRTKEPEETGRYWPFSMDYWGIARTDVETLLAPHVGRRIRVKGHFKKTYDDATWAYEVDPVKITALADEPGK